MGTRRLSEEPDEEKLPGLLTHQFLHELPREPGGQGGRNKGLKTSQILV